MERRPATARGFKIRNLLRPHSTALAVGLLAAVGEGLANRLEPWPLKIIFDSVLKSQPTHGWLNRLIMSTAGEDKIAILKFAVAAVILIALLDAVCSYTEKYFTTSVSRG
ncbi:MAG TPA: hypothetical protein VG204_18510 [Terriglobia bacterium]|nr:hypothetical protein [Terriglobia bacterium]